MIHPVPPGIDPATHRCGECGADFRMPLIEGRETLICRADEAHDTYQSKHKETRHLRRIDGSLTEVNILTGKETTELAPITDHATALAAVRRSIEVGQFSGKQTELQIIQIAQLAMAYGLDPMMEEIIPMYGKPYITIKGRRRLDAAAGNRFGLVWKVPDAEFLNYYQSVEAIDPGDVVAVAIGTYIDHPETPTEVWARCKKHEVAGNDSHLPINAWKLEMAQKRAERKLREQLFGPIPRPKGLEHIEVLQEGDEANIVEGTAKVIEEPSQTAPVRLPDYGECAFHPSQMFKTIEAKHGLLISHPNGKDEEGKTLWCHYHKVLQGQFLHAWEANHDGQRNQNEINDWLKKECGDTWSKLTIEQMKAAIDDQKVTRSDVDTVTGEILDAPESNAQDEIDEAEYRQFITAVAETQPGEE